MTLYTMGNLFRWLLAIAVLVNADGNPLIMKWSHQTYGPDGPWHAVSVELGSNQQPIDLYPGDRWASTILIDTICSGNSSTPCYARRAGLFNISASTSAFLSDTPTDTSEIQWLSNQESSGVNKWGATGYVKERILADTIKLPNSHKVPNVSMTAIYDAYQEYPNGKRNPVSVGILSLGGLRPTHLKYKFNMICAWEHWNETSNYRIPSYSWGMHIGSVDLNIPGSLILGGYDQARVLGQVISPPIYGTPDFGSLTVSLADIGIGVATGNSPFDFQNKSGLFKLANGTTSSLNDVNIDPALPYLYLPKETCDAIAAELPVTFNEGLGLYFWNTDENYQKITSSPAYMSFTFQSQPNITNVTIKVPFQLLDLTLQAPLVELNTTYFPCYPSSSFILGRAFLQAAFIGTNWGEGIGDSYLFLAQAPGPAIGPKNIQSIEISDSSLKVSAKSWEDTWDGYWVPLSSNSSNSGLSTGAKAGIGIGCAIGGLALIGIIAWLIVSRRKRRTNSRPATTDGYSIAPKPAEGINLLQVTELDARHVSELQSDKGIQEAPGSTAIRHELL
ncbi:hypothetical protein N7463_007283 [Penicillium fimorum]|uniref:Peptidase A1 domain-containing protein n=1 Tax=Penicillium fimorum TaxID=1882269 RepID=A0A9X0C6V2_9EURO|nr:hypothetical protein N7463_007283 [Penicillium fimorum]